jgi:anaerobic ribonucleoside-triphosphate reductase activating protein
MTQDARPFTGGYSSSVTNLAERILSVPEVEGITLSGGEPFAQASALAALIRQVRIKRDMGVMVYTGYTLAEIQRRAAGDNGVAHLLANVDLLIDGRYQAKLDDGGRWRGSSNQVAHCLTPRYREAVSAEFGQPGRRIELHLQQKGVMLAGVPGEDALALWLKMTKKGANL